MAEQFETNIDPLGDTATTTDKLDREAKELVDSFMFAGIYFKDGDEGAKRTAINCTIIHCDLMIEKLKKGVGEYFVNNQSHYTNLKQRIESL